MDSSLEYRIRERAYEIWIANGRVNGQDDQHWLAAEQEILAKSGAVFVTEPSPQKKQRPVSRPNHKSSHKRRM
jgi:hypothetical protein